MLGRKADIRRHRRSLTFCRVCTLFLSEIFKTSNAAPGRAGLVHSRDDMITLQVTPSFGAGPDLDGERVWPRRQSRMPADAVSRAFRICDYKVLEITTNSSSGSRRNCCTSSLSGSMLPFGLNGSCLTRRDVRCLRRRVNAGQCNRL
jgi:hypothetical protein